MKFNIEPPVVETFSWAEITQKTGWFVATSAVNNGDIELILIPEVQDNGMKIGYLAINTDPRYLASQPTIHLFHEGHTPGLDCRRQLRWKRYPGEIRFQN